MLGETSEDQETEGEQMKQVLVTKDGVVINPSQITTARVALDGDSYQKDVTHYSTWIEEIKRAEQDGHLDAAKAFQAGCDQAFPKGRPDFTDYMKTQVRLSDGQILWVDKDLASVRVVMDRG